MSERAIRFRRKTHPGAIDSLRDAATPRELREDADAWLRQNELVRGTVREAPRRVPSAPASQSGDSGGRVRKERDVSAAPTIRHRRGRAT